MRRSGGLGVFVKDELLKYVEVIESKSDYVFWIKLKNDVFNPCRYLVIGIVYIPPESSNYYKSDELLIFENEVFESCNMYDHVLLTGDANAHIGLLQGLSEPDNFLSRHFDFDDDMINFFSQADALQNLDIPIQRVSKDLNINTTGRMLIDLCINNNLYILNGRFGQDSLEGAPTFRNLSVIDYSITSAKLLPFLIDFSITEVDCLYSDGHSLLTTCLNFDKTESTSQQNEPLQTISHPRWQDNKCNDFLQNIDQNIVLCVENLLNEFPSEISEQKNALDRITENISVIFQNSAEVTFNVNKDSHVFTKYKNNQIHNKKNKPWYGPRCRNKRVIYNRARKNFSQNKSVNNRRLLNRASIDYKRTMKFYMNRHNFINESKLRNMHSSDPKSYWRFLNSLNRNNSTNVPDIKVFYEYFQKVNKVTDNEESFHVDDTNMNFDDDILNSPFTNSEISKVINKCKNGKAFSRSDNISNEYIKSTEHIMLPIYTKLFNKILETGLIPTTWSEGYIIPIYKGKGSTYSPENYRPITILSCLSKLFTSALNERLTKFVDTYNLLNENQCGFRKNHSTLDHVFTLNFLVELLKSQKSKLFVGFIDFSRAFDNLPRAQLFQKLINTGINGKFLRIVRNMYDGIKSCVQLNNNVSAMFSCECGVRQGENLSPLMFSLFLNDLLEHLESKGNTGLTLQYAEDEITYNLTILALLFADDTIILAKTAHEFQKCLNDFDLYCKTWKLQINTQKTKVMVFGSNRRGTRNMNFSINNEILEITDEYKYLGVVFSQSGKYKKARDHLISQSRKAMHLLYKRIFNLNLPIDLQLKLFDNTILPILTFSCEVWGIENNTDIEKVHLEFLRKITNSKKKYPGLYALW